MTGNAVVINFSGGETSPRSRGRFDQPWYQTSFKKGLNFISELQGPARFRPGFVFCKQTRQGQVARLLDFQLSDILAYILELTPGYLRIYDPTTQDLLTSTQATITGISQATAGVVTVSSITGISNGNEIILDGIVGMPQLNNRQVTVSNISGNTFRINDSVTGNPINTTGYGAYASGGTVSVVYEITTPYSALDLANLQAASADGFMYIVCPRQAPQKLTVNAAGQFTISAFSRTNDPFALGAQAVNIEDVRPSYEGDPRIESGATMTPGATSGTGVIFTASAPVFTSYDVGKYIWKVPTGSSATGQGRAIITSFTDPQHVVCTILTAFDATTAIPLGIWQVVTCCTVVALAPGSVVNASLTYIFAGVGGATGINGGTYYLVPYEIPTVNFPRFVPGSSATVSNPRYIIRTTSNFDIDSSSWGTYSGGGTATPSSSQPTLTLTGISLGTKTIVTFSSGGTINPNVGYAFSGVGGTTQLNGQTYFLKQESDGIHLTLSDGTEIDSSAWTAYTSGGIAVVTQENPLSVAFYEGRLWYGGTNLRPDCIFGSMSPDDNGNSQYDNFTGGSLDDNACFFQLAPTGGSTSYISWLRGGPDYLFCGTFGGPYRISGSGLDIPITPNSINVRQFDTAGAEETMSAGLSQMFFIQRAGVSLRSIKVINPYLATFESADLCLNAEQIAYSPLQRIVLQRGRPDCLWTFRADGQLAGMSVHITQQNADTLTGWHRHQLGGEGTVQDIAVSQRQNGLDQVWIVSQRTINGVQKCFVEVMADDIYFPDPEDFFGSSGPIVAPYKNPQEQNTQSGLGSQTTDLQNWMNAVWRLIGECVSGLDAELAYDGSLRGIDAGATLTPSAVGSVQAAGQVAVPITLTASEAVFAASDVGSEIWVKPNAVTGIGAGRATITGYTSSAQVSAVVTVPFSSTNPVNAGDWYFAVSTFYGFGHLEGQIVAVTADGAVVSEGGQSGDPSYPVIAVTNGTITLPAGNLGQPQRAAILRAGLPYMGFLKTHNLEMGGRSGPAEAKPRDISEIYVRFMNALGAEFGTDIYKLQKIEHRLSNAITNRGAPVFSGLQRLKLEDSWVGLDDYHREKNVIVMQRLPLPCVVESLDMYYNTSEEQGTE
jgi:hypothetical protein